MIFSIPELGELEMNAVKAIDELRQQLRWQVADQPRRWFGLLRRQIFAKAVQGSNSIEGYNASFEDVLAAVNDEPPGDANEETRWALEGYRDAMTYVLQLAESNDRLQIDETLIKALHFMMLKRELKKWPGRYRPGSIFVRRDPGGEIVYEGPEADLLPSLMADLTESLANPGSQPPLVSAAMAHLNLAMIHPFRDGNGRMARCVQTMVLARESIVAPVFSSIEEYLGRNTELYYNVLGTVGQGSWHPGNDARPWIRFCLNGPYQQIQTQLWRIREAESLWDKCTELAKKYGLPERAIGPLSDAARGLRLRNWSYRRVVKDSTGDEIDVQTASRDLRALVDAKLMDVRGETRGRVYVGGQILRGLFAEVRATKPKRENADLFPDDKQLNFPLAATR